MQFFKYNSFTSSGSLANGEPIHNLKRSTWIERYDTAGEFIFEAPLHSGLHLELPVGTCVSHSDTYDVMRVENHEISEDNEEETVIITGRDLFSIFEERIVGGSINWGGFSNTRVQQTLTANFIQHQIVALLNLVNNGVEDAYSSFSYLTDVTTTGESIERTISLGTMFEKVLELLPLGGLGLRVLRVNPFGVVGSTTQTQFLIHDGNDRTSSVVFSSGEGDIASAVYLRSGKTFRNAAYVESTYLTTAVLPVETGTERKWIYVDAKDLDQDFSSEPLTTIRDDILNKMIERGKEALARHNELEITQIEVSQESRHSYRLDYDIGDLVSVQGAYGDIEARRVSEYTEIEDEVGYSAFPTLTKV